MTGQVRFRGKSSHAIVPTLAAGDGMMKRTLLIIAGVLVLFGAIAACVVYVCWNQAVPIAAMAINYVRYLNAPAGTLVTEENPSWTQGAVLPSPPPPAATTGDWPSYNKTLTSERFAPLDEINTHNAGRLKILCTYDTGQYTGFTTGLIEVNGALIGTTEYDIFSLDPANCHQNWRAHEDYQPATPQGVNRGAAYMDGRLFRGTQDGRVLAYDFKTGKRLWATQIANPKIGETVPAAPIAWNGLVFAGNAGGDIKGVKGRMYALDAASGRIVWEFYLVPKSPGDITRGPQGTSPLDLSTWNNAAGFPITGGATWTSYTLDPKTGLLYVPGGNPAPDFATGPRKGKNLFSGSVVVLDARTGDYKYDFKIVPVDWHDWDVSNPPAIIHTDAGKEILVVTPKNGFLYGFDLSDNRMLYHTPVTRVENADATFARGKSVHFCPGSTGGAEWNGSAYDPQTDLIYVGEVDWCTTVTLMSERALRSVPAGQPWSGEASLNPYETWGNPDPFGQWGGWLYASDAETGGWKWRAHTNYPIQSGVTPTAGGVVFFGDMGGNFYALDAADGHRLWGRKIGGAIGGGVITYTAGGRQKVAVATGLTEVLWPTEITTAKVSILGLASRP
jgi:alcohol dehydrogenase (cytochrome c)